MEAKGPVQPSFWEAKATLYKELAKNYTGSGSQTKSQSKDQPCEVLPNLYLASHEVEQNLELLRSRNITHVLQVCVGIDVPYSFLQA